MSYNNNGNCPNTPPGRRTNPNTNYKTGKSALFAPKKKKLEPNLHNVENDELVVNVGKKLNFHGMPSNINGQSQTQETELSKMMRELKV